MFNCKEFSLGNVLKKRKSNCHNSFKYQFFISYSSVAPRQKLNNKKHSPFTFSRLIFKHIHLQLLMVGILKKTNKSCLLLTSMAQHLIKPLPLWYLLGNALYSAIIPAWQYCSSFRLLIKGKKLFIHVKAAEVEKPQNEFHICMISTTSNPRHGLTWLWQ